MVRLPPLPDLLKLSPRRWALCRSPFARNEAAFFVQSVLPPGTLSEASLSVCASEREMEGLRRIVPTRVVKRGLVRIAGEDAKHFFQPCYGQHLAYQQNRIDECN